MRAEAQLTGIVDEDDEADEQIFMSESLELYYNISEVIGSMLRAHGSDYLSIYQSSLHSIINDMYQPYCLKEDQQFALYIISDVIEFGLTNTANSTNNVNEYTAVFYQQTIPILNSICLNTISVGPRQAAAYSIGICAENNPIIFLPYVNGCLEALAKSIIMGEGDGNNRGQCTDTSVASVGIILEVTSLLLDNTQLNYDLMWNQWLNYLPLKDDIVSCSFACHVLLCFLNDCNDRMKGRKSFNKLFV